MKTLKYKKETAVAYYCISRDLIALKHSEYIQIWDIDERGNHWITDAILFSSCSKDFVKLGPINETEYILFGEK